MNSALWMVTLGAVALGTTACGTDSGKATTEDPTTDDSPCTPSSFYADADGDGAGDPFVVAQSCTVPEGFTSNADDCDDTDPEQHPGQVWYPDGDGDGLGDGAAAVTGCLRPMGHLTTDGDCDDLDSTRYPGAVWYLDQDGDGAGDPGAAIDACGDVTGAVPEGTDCDDTDWLRHPAADEVCDAIDNDCDGLVDDEDDDVDPFSQLPLYQDLDGDEYGTDVEIGLFCPSLPEGAAVSGDCDDTDPNIHPHRLDYNDPVDSNCDGTPDVVLAEDMLGGWIGFDNGSFSMFMASKDVDGDGIHEVLVSAPAAALLDEGRVGYFPGSVGVGDRTQWPDEPLVRTWTGSAVDGAFGYALNFIGDWNGDGIEDFVVGAPDSHSKTGEVYILSTDDNSTTVGAALFTSTFSHTDAYWGYDSVAVGDVTGDGLDDVLVSARRDDRVGPSQGSVTLIPGGGTEADMVVTNAISSYDQLGYSMAAAGDMDGDGALDVVLGAPYADYATSNGGEIYRVPAQDFADPVVLEEMPMFYGVEEQERAGTALRGAGDVNGDGYDDVLIGAPSYDHGGLDLEDAGAAYVALGSGTVGDNLALSDAHWRIIGTTIDHDTGRYLGAFGDVSGDGLADVFVTTHKWDDGDQLEVGRVYGILGSVDGGTRTVPDEADLIIQGADQYDYLGRGMAAAGDTNGDGLADFWLGASGAGSTGSLFLMEGAAASW